MKRKLSFIKSFLVTIIAVMLITESVFLPVNAASGYLQTDGDALVTEESSESDYRYEGGDSGNMLFTDEIVDISSDEIVEDGIEKSMDESTDESTGQISEDSINESVSEDETLIEESNLEEYNPLLLEPVCIADEEYVISQLQSYAVADYTSSAIYKKILNAPHTYRVSDFGRGYFTANLTAKSASGAVNYVIPYPIGVGTCFAYVNEMFYYLFGQNFSKNHNYTTGNVTLQSGVEMIGKLFNDGTDGYKRRVQELVGRAKPGDIISATNQKSFHHMVFMSAQDTNGDGLADYYYTAEGNYDGKKKIIINNKRNIDYLVKDKHYSVSLYRIKNYPDLPVTAPPVITKSEVSGINYSSGTYTVKSWITAEAGLDRVQFPTWTDAGGQDDLPSNWESSSSCSGNLQHLGGNSYLATFTVNINTHNYERGSYNTHIYAYDKEYRRSGAAAVTVSHLYQEPSMTEVRVSDVNRMDGTYTVTAVINAPAGLKRVQFPAWTVKDGQDDIFSQWRTSQKASGTVSSLGNGRYRAVYTVRVSDHNDERGEYISEVYAYDNYDRMCSKGAGRVNMDYPLDLFYSQFSVADYSLGEALYSIAVGKDACIDHIEFLIYPRGAKDLAVTVRKDVPYDPAMSISIGGAEYFNHHVELNLSAFPDSDISELVVETILIAPNGVSRSYFDSIDLGEPKSGLWGENKIIWTYSDTDHTLTISGKGDIEGRGLPSAYPWSIYEDQVERLIITEGIIDIPPFAFKGMKNLEQIDLPKSLSAIQQEAFGDCSGISDTLYIPAGVTYIGGSAFGGTSVKNVIFEGRKPGISPVNAIINNGILIPLETEEEDAYRSYNSRITASYIRVTGPDDNGLYMQFIQNWASFPEDAKLFYPSSLESNWKTYDELIDYEYFSNTKLEWSGKTYGGYECIAIGFIEPQITFEDSELFVEKGEKVSTEAEIMPEGIIDRTLYYTSANPEIATVSRTGEVTGISFGSTLITASTRDGKASASCTVYVRDPEVHFEVELNKEKIILAVDEGTFLSAVITPVQMGITGIFSWASDNPAVASVDEEGNIFGINAGSTYIRAYSKETGEEGVCQVLVTPSADVDENTIWISNISDQVYTGSAITFDVGVYKGSTLLTKGRDYTISFKNNTKAAGRDTVIDSKAPLVIVKGKGNYSGVVTKFFTINPKNITDEDIEISLPEHMTLPEKGNLKVEPVIKHGKKKLTKGDSKDYSVTLYRYKPTVTEGSGSPSAVLGGEGGIDTFPDEGFERVSVIDSVGTYKVVMSGNGNYWDDAERIVKVSDSIDIGKVTIVGKDYSYTGETVIPDPILTYKVKGRLYTLKKDIDYKIEPLEKNIWAGTGKVLISAVEKEESNEDKEASSGISFCGSRVWEFKINGTNLSKVKVMGLTEKTYTAGSIKPKPQIFINYGKEDEQLLTEGTDFSLEYSSNKAKGTGTVIITGIGRYSGTLKKTFKIAPRDINDAILHNESLTVSYRKGGSIIPDIELVFNNEKLLAGRDYSISYSANKSISNPNIAQRPCATLKGKGNYKGTRKIYFSIIPADFSEMKINTVNIYLNKKGFKPDNVVTLTDVDGKTLKENIDYKLSQYEYTEAVKIFNASRGGEILRQNGDIVETGDMIPDGTRLRLLIRPMSTGYYCTNDAIEVSLYVYSKTLQKAKCKAIVKQYNGDVVFLERSEIVLTDATGEPVDTDQIEIMEHTYRKNDKKGKASVTIKGVNGYGGTCVISFNISAKSVSGEESKP